MALFRDGVDSFRCVEGTVCFSAIFGFGIGDRSWW